MTERPKGSGQRTIILHGIIFSFLLAVFAELVLGVSFAWTDPMSSLGRASVVFLSIFVVFRFTTTSFRSSKTKERKNFVTLLIVLVGNLAFIWIGRLLALSLSAYTEHSKVVAPVSVGALSTAIPWGTGVLILQAILGLEFACIGALSTALLAAVYFQTDTLLLPYIVCTSFAAALSLVRFRSRSAYIKAGFNIALVSLPLSLASFLVVSDISVTDGLVRVVAGFIGGIFCAFLAVGLTPLFEYAGGYFTDMRLIELATLDHPLLKELSIQAPGTWNHSMVMGMMAEAAAEAVGANSVLARVGAYFHDIGKIKKPIYFVENQMGEDNRHDKLSTSMSALIIRAHVKDGIELAKHAKLPQSLQDMIPQHHGTSVIEYFYNKAIKEAKDAGLDPSEVDKSLYSYPGPKPQTKEAAILMLADGIEAAARTLSEYNSDRIQGMVQKLINKVFASGELNECELTLQDLHRIAKSFTRVLTGIYHQRIAYAEPAEKAKEDRPKEPLKEEERAPVVESNGASKKTSDPSGEESSKEPRKEDLKRLGL